jgi:hypothetical protein
MHATVRYRPMGWGTQVAVQVTGIPLHTVCAIEAYGPNGTLTVGGSWITDSNEGKVWYTASAAASKDAVAKFVITVAGHPATVITRPDLSRCCQGIGNDPGNPQGSATADPGEKAIYIHLHRRVMVKSIEIRVEKIIHPA